MASKILWGIVLTTPWQNSGVGEFHISSSLCFSSGIVLTRCLRTIFSSRTTKFRLGISLDYKQPTPTRIRTISILWGSLWHVELEICFLTPSLHKTFNSTLFARRFLSIISTPSRKYDVIRNDSMLKWLSAVKIDRLLTFLISNMYPKHNLNLSHITIDVSITQLLPFCQHKRNKSV